MSFYKHSVALDESKCKACINCLKSCPTEAIRIKDGHAVIDSRRCIDCGECIKKCPRKAKSSVADKFSELPFKKKFLIALPPPSLYGQFENLDDADYLLQGLLDIGFDYVYEVARAAELVTEYTRQYLKRDDIKKPVISSACPVVTRLIALRFPTLVEHLMPIHSPMEIAARRAKEEVRKLHPELRDEDIAAVFISPCTAKISAVKNSPEDEPSAVDYVVPVSEVYFELIGAMGKIDVPEPISRTGMVGMSWAVSGGEASALLNDRYLAADGIKHIIKVLDEIETGTYPFVEFIELNACSSGCVGGALTVGNPYLTKVKIQSIKRYLPVMHNRPSVDEVKEIPEDYSFSRFECEPIKLHPDRKTAMKLMIEIQNVCKHLPEYDCGACGSPNCRTFAEDVVLGRADVSGCVMLKPEEKESLKQELDREAGA